MQYTAYCLISTRQRASVLVLSTRVLEYVHVRILGQRASVLVLSTRVLEYVHVRVLGTSTEVLVLSTRVLEYVHVRVLVLGTSTEYSRYRYVLVAISILLQ